MDDDLKCHGPFARHHIHANSGPWWGSVPRDRAGVRFLHPLSFLGHSRYIMQFLLKILGILAPAGNHVPCIIAQLRTSPKSHSNTLGGRAPCAMCAGVGVRFLGVFLQEPVRAHMRIEGAETARSRCSALPFIGKDWPAPTGRASRTGNLCSGSRFLMLNPRSIAATRAAAGARHPQFCMPMFSHMTQ